MNPPTEPTYIIETPNGEVLTFTQAEWEAFTADHGHPPDYFI